MSVAHELGHFILHRSLIRAGQTSADLSEDRLEAEAYQFAGELLMPEWWVRMVYRHHPAPHESCQVSRTAWRRRLVDLGLGTAEPEPIASVTVAPIRGVARATLVPSP
jgi:Zn-dependent peptidase ImmA (M78 family)